MEQRLQALDAISGKTFQLTTKPPARSISNVTTKTSRCPLCQKEHMFYQCETFKNLSVEQRNKEIKTNGLFANCLRSSKHFANQCFIGCYKICHKKHNTLMHSTAYNKRAINFYERQCKISNNAQIKGFRGYC